MPSLRWQTWVRLAFVEAGSDWRSLSKLAVEDGMLRDFALQPDEAWRAGVLVAEHRRRLAEAEQRLPAYRGRRGEAFAFEEELREKEDELHALEAALAGGAGAPGEEDEREAA